MSDPSITDWINAVAGAVGTIAVVSGLIVANFKITEAQRTARQLRRSQVAEELISLAYSVEDAFHDIRNPIYTVPREKAGDKAFLCQRRYDRILHYDDLFRRLRDAQIRVRAVVGLKCVDDAVNELFKARYRVAAAAEGLAYYEQNSDPAHVEAVMEQQKKLRQELNSNSSKKDVLGQLIKDSVQSIDENLRPVARLEARN